MPFTTTQSWFTKLTLVVLLAVLTLVSATWSADDKQVSVYSPVASYSLPVLERSGHQYVGLLELLEPLGRVSSEAKGAALRLRYNAVDAEFVAGKTRGRIHGHNFDFSAPLLIENSRGLVPLNSLGGMLPLFLGNAVSFHESARRLFVGEAGIQMSFKLDSGAPPRLAMNFSAPVNPTISTEPGKLRMVFKRDPVVSPGSQAISFDNKVITQASYSEDNGSAELDISAKGPLMATFSNDRKTIIVAVIPPISAVGSQNPAQSGPSANSGSGSASSNTNVVIHRVLVVVDAAHGGEERGAALTETLAEKEVTLGFSRLLRHELETRGFAVMMPRDSDATLTLDQRAAAANVAHAGIYISLHAVSQGEAAHIFTSLLPPEGTSKGVFHSWNDAQASALPVSRAVATAIVSELQKKQIAVQESSASLRPLNNVLMPAVAVELAPGLNGAADLTSANYQQRVAAAVADGVFLIRDRLVVQP